MSLFSISFAPPIERIGAPVTDAWIEAFDWSKLDPGGYGDPELLVSFCVDGQQFSYYPDTADGVLGELMESLSAVISVEQGAHIVCAVQGYTVLCAQAVGGGLQFYSPANSYEGAQRLPLDRLDVVGQPIATQAVELVLREAIASVAQLIAQTRARATKE